jgi:hypothetical protein
MSRTLVSIRSDEHNAIRLTANEGFGPEPALTMVIEDGSGIHVFSFANAHELHTFALRLMDEAQSMIV